MFDEIIIYEPYNINPQDEDKRIRVFAHQLTDTIIDNTTLANFNFQIGFYFKTGIHLIERFPHREIELNKILITFWKKMQLRYKQLQEKYLW